MGAGDAAVNPKESSVPLNPPEGPSHPGSLPKPAKPLNCTVSKRPLTVRELLQRLKPYGVEVLTGRGERSETWLLMPEKPGADRGPMYSIRNHGPSTEISVSVINSLLSRFGIDKNSFWNPSAQVKLGPFSGLDLGHQILAG
jgi:hypothetical protein